MQRKQHGLSKSKIGAYEQCPKRLWLQVHRPELAETDDAAAARFATGHDIGALACSLCPGGVMVEVEPDLAAAVATTRRLLDERHPGPIFEATFVHDGVLVRIDILERDAGCWAIREVKSSMSAKPHHAGDLATQVWVAGQAGLSVSAASIRHVNREFMLEEEGGYGGLFVDSDLLDDIADTIRGREQLVGEARAMLAGPEPALVPGDHCSSPYSCEFATYCNRDLPAGPEWPVELLPNGGGRKWREAGVEDVLKIDAANIVGRQGIVIRATQTGVPFQNAEEARRTVGAWPFPRAWIDFETIAFAAPRWVGTRPYQQVPFQFSLHVEAPDGTCTHRDFLHLDGSDPRRPCAEALLAQVPEGATLVAYNAPFEKGVLRGLAAAVPEHATRLLAMADAVVDLLPVARNCWYHRDQRGSWSLKAVLPTVGDIGYAGLEVKDGAMAQQAYLQAVDPGISSARRQAIDAALRAYCERDTWAMVALARRLVAAGDPAEAG